MDSILMREEPLIKKCCYVIPLRLCIQTWAFLKIAVDLVGIAYMAVGILMMFAFGGEKASATVAFFMALVAVALAIDVGFLITLTVGILNKNIYLIRVFYIYEWVAMAIETSCIIFIFVKIAEAGMNAEGVVVIVIGIIYILLDLCIIVTLKSEIVKLRKKKQFDFSRISRECEVMGKLRSEDLRTDNICE